MYVQLNSKNKRKIMLKNVKMEYRQSSYLLLKNWLEKKITKHSTQKFQCFEALNKILLNYIQL